MKLHPLPLQPPQLSIQARPARGAPEAGSAIAFDPNTAAVSATKPIGDQGGATSVRNAASKAARAGAVDTKPVPSARGQLTINRDVDGSAPYAPGALVNIVA